MKNEKTYDAVKMMREIRDKMSKELSKMSYEEQKRYLMKNMESKTEPEKDAHAA